MTTVPDRVFILESTPEKVEVYRLDDGKIGLSCGALLLPSSALQLQHGLQAVLSGLFDRAVSVEEFDRDLARRTPIARHEVARPTHTPSLGDL